MLSDTQLDHAYRKIVKKKSLITRRAMNRKKNEMDRIAAVAKRAPAGSLGASLR